MRPGDRLHRLYASAHGPRSVFSAKRTSVSRSSAVAAAAIATAVAAASLWASSAAATSASAARSIATASSAVTSASAAVAASAVGSRVWYINVPGRLQRADAGRDLGLHQRRVLRRRRRKLSRCLLSVRLRLLGLWRAVGVESADAASAIVAAAFNPSGASVGASAGRSECSYTFLIFNLYTHSTAWHCLPESQRSCSS